MTTEHPTPGYCDTCDARCIPRWALVEVYPHRRYAAYCRPCWRAFEADFTPEAAILAARAIVAEALQGVQR
jgi:hypothetical protein